MNEKIMLRTIEILISMIVLITSILTLTLDINFKGIPALSFGILMGLFCYQEWMKITRNIPIFLLLFLVSIFNCFVGIILFF